MANIPTSLRLDDLAQQELGLLLSDQNVSRSFKDFIKTYVMVCQNSETPRVFRKEFVEALKAAQVSSSPAMVTKRFKELVSLDATSEEIVYIEERKNKVITLKTLEPLISHYSKNKNSVIPSHKPKKKDLAMQIDAINSGQQTFLAFNTEQPSRIESLLCILDAAVRLSGHDDAKEIECGYSFTKDDEIKIHSSTSARDDAELMILSDERAIRAINGVILDTLETKYGDLSQITLTDLSIKDQMFGFDIYDLCRRMKLEPSQQNRDIAIKMLARLRDTEFKVDASDSAYFKTNYSAGADIIYYRYFTEFYAKKDYQETKDGRVEIPSQRYFIIKPHSTILANLLTLGRSFISHPELDYEPNGLAHRLNNVSKSVVGVRDKLNGNDIFEYTFDEYKEKISPASRMDNFYSTFIRLFNRELDKGNGLSDQVTAPGSMKIRLYGYFYELYYHPEKVRELNRKRGRRSYLRKEYPIVRVSRDIDDIYVGNNSDHNKANQRIAAKIKQGSQPTLLTAAGVQ